MLEKINRISNWQVALAILLVGLTVFFTGLTNPFQGDDFLQIVNNPVVHSLAHTTLFFDSSTFYSGQGMSLLKQGYYRPLMTTTFSLLYTLFGAHSFYFHLVQLAICISSSFILYLVFRRFNFNALLSLVLALLFLVHPLDSQVVLAIPSMQDALFFFFGILGFYLLIRFDSVRGLGIVTVCFMLAILSKEAGFYFITAALLYLWLWRRKRLYLFGAMALIATAIYILLRLHAVGLGTNANAAPIDDMSLAGRLLTAPSMLLFYLTKFVFPWKLASAYYWVYPHFSVEHVLAPLLIDLVVVGLIVYLGSIVRSKASDAERRVYLFFALWSGLGLLPVVVQLSPTDMTVCETWAYFSMVGLLGMVGVWLITFQARINPRWFGITAVVVVAMLSTRTALRGSDWSSAHKLAVINISASKEDYIAYSDLARDALKQGNYREGLVYAQRSTEIFPTQNNYINLATAQADLGKYATAAQTYNQTNLKYGGSVEAYENLAELAVIIGNPDSNEGFLRSVLSRYPNDAVVWTYLAILEQKNGDNTAAKAAITRAASHGQVPQFIYRSILENQSFTITVPGRSIGVPQARS